MTSDELDVAWTAARPGLTLGDQLVVSFQRYCIHGAPPLPCIPTSLGAMEPIGTGPRRFIIPLHPDEAVWLGIEFKSAARELRIRAHSAEGGSELLVWPASAGALEMLAGLPLGDMKARRFEASGSGWNEIEVDPCARGVGSAWIELVGPGRFTELTGQPSPPPARRGEGYGGWRLP